MPTIDPNTYAIDLAMSIDTVAASTAIAQLETQISNLEEQLQSVSENAFADIQGPTDEMGDSLRVAADNVATISDLSAGLTLNLGRASDDAAMLVDSADQQIKFLNQEIKRWEDIKDLYDEFSAITENELVNNKKFLGQLDDIENSIQGKNVAHQDELDLVNDENKAVDDLGKSFEEIQDSIKENNNQLETMRRLLLGLVDIIRGLGEDQEKFVTANYRVYGSQVEMVRATRDIVTETGLLRDEAIAAYQALANVKTPIEDMDRLAIAVGELDRITGIGTETWATYSKQLRTIGVDTDRQIDQFNKMAVAQRQMGISTKNLERAMNDNKLTAEEMTTYFGGEAYEAFTDANVALEAMQQNLLLDEKSMKAWKDQLQAITPQAVAFWESAGGLAADSSPEERFAAMGEAAGNALEEMGFDLSQFQSQLETLQGTEEGRLELERISNALSQAYGLSLTDIRQMYEAQGQLNKAGLAHLSTLEEMNKFLEDHHGLIADLYSEANETVPRQLQIMSNLIQSLSAGFEEFLSDAAIPVLQKVNELIIYFADLGKLFHSAFDFEFTGDFATDFDGFVSDVIDGFNLVLDKVTKDGTELFDTVVANVKLYGPKVIDAFDTIGSKIGSTLADWWIEYIQPGMVTMSARIGVFLGDMWDDAVQPALQFVFGHITDFIGDAWLGITGDPLASPTAFGSMLGSAIRNIWVSSILPAFGFVYDNISGFITDMWAGITDDPNADPSAFGVRIGDGVQAIWGNFIEPALMFVVDNISGFIGNMWAGIMDDPNADPSAFGTKLGSMINDAWSTYVLPALDTAWDNLKDYLFTTVLPNVGVELVEALKTMFVGIISHIPDMASGIGSAIVDGITSGFEGAIDSFKGTVSDSWEWIKDKFNPYARSSPSMVEFFQMGLDEMRGATGQFADLTVAKWGDLSKASADNFVNMSAASDESLRAMSGNFDDLISTISGFDIDVPALSAISTYANTIENASTKIETALQAKAIPAMLAADKSGIDEVAQADTITTVKVLHEQEGSSDSRERSYQDKMLSVLQELSETVKLSLTSGQGTTALAAIVALLEEHLPEMAQNSGGLESDYNKWN